MYSEPADVFRQEAHHRFLNTLTLLHGLLRRDFEGFHDLRVRTAVSKFEAQLLAFASIQRSLQAAPGGGRLDVPAHFAQLCEQLAAVLLTPRGVKCAFAADEGEMDGATGEKVGLIVAELVTNAAKHAFPGFREGCVSIVLRQSEGRWRCGVKDNGAGLGAGPSGSGLRLIEGLAHSIGARLTISSGKTGVEVNVTLPAPRAPPRQDPAAHPLERPMADLPMHAAHVRAE